MRGRRSHHHPRPDPCALQVDDLTAAAEQEAEAASVYDDEYIEFDPYLFIRKLPPLDAVVPASRVALLPRQARLGSPLVSASPGPHVMESQTEAQEQPECALKEAGLTAGEIT